MGYRVWAMQIYFLFDEFKPFSDWSIGLKY